MICPKCSSANVFYNDLTPNVPVDKHKRVLYCRSCYNVEVTDVPRSTVCSHPTDCICGNDCSEHVEDAGG